MNFKILITCIGLFILPFLFWGNNYRVGGDDTKLYYVFPEKFIQNYVFNIISDNTLAGAITGYAPVSYYAPFFFVLWLLHKIPLLNPQMVAYGLNFSLGFYFFYRLFCLILQLNGQKTRYFGIIASLFYISSVYLVQTVYSHQLMAIYLVSVLPAVLYFFTKSIVHNSIYSLFTSVLIFSIFSTTINTLPWWSSFGITIIPYFVYLLIQYKFKFFRYSMHFLLLFIPLNAYWLIHFIYSSIGHTGLAASFDYYQSQSFITDNYRIITGVSKMFLPINILFQRMDSSIGDHITIFTIIGSIPMILIIIGGLVSTTRKVNRPLIYSVCIISFLISWLLFSPNIGNWSTNFFLTLSKIIPFFTMYRNMYDKFAIPLAFHYSILFGLSLIYIWKVLPLNKYIRLFFIGSAILSLVYSGQSFLFSANAITDASRPFSGTFGADFTELSRFIRENYSSEKVMWLPLNEPAYTYIVDGKNPDWYYAGLSPLRELADVTDYTGRFSFLIQKDVNLGAKIFDMIRNGEFERFGAVLQSMNIRYIVVDNQILPTSVKQFFYGGINTPLLTIQSPQLYKAILGNKIRDFGSLYSLYEISQKFNSARIFYPDQNNSFPTDLSKITSIKQTSNSYDVTVKSLKGEQNIVLLEAFNTQWNLILMDGSRSVNYQMGKNTVFGEYANKWSIDEEDVKRLLQPSSYTTNPDESISFRMKIEFYPQVFSWIGNSISLITAVGILSGIVIFSVRKRLSEKIHCI